MLQEDTPTPAPAASITFFTRPDGVIEFYPRGGNPRLANPVIINDTGHVYVGGWKIRQPTNG